MKKLPIVPKHPDSPNDYIGHCFSVDGLSHFFSVTIFTPKSKEVPPSTITKAAQQLGIELKKWVHN